MVGTNTGRNGLSCASFIRKYSLALNLRKKKNANLKLQQDVRFPFTQLMKTRSTMVEDTKDTYFCISLFFPFFFFDHQIFTLKHSLARKRGLKRCSVPSVHMGVHMLQLSEKGVGCLGQLIASPRVSCTAPRSKPPLPAPPPPPHPPPSIHPSSSGQQLSNNITAAD